VRTVEGLNPDGELTPLQQAFTEHHALQCGYCTPGMLVSATALLERNPRPSDEEIRRALQGNICRCTGYWNIIKAVKAASGQEVEE
jgi:carbon-monoxide dehydrogenase small subunit